MDDGPGPVVAMPSPSVIELRTLGGCDLHDPTGEADVHAILSQPRRLSLLVYLAVAEPRGFHRRDTLLGLFWRDFEQTRARAALRRALHFIRSTLGEGILVGRGDDSVGLDPIRFRCDTWSFRDALVKGRREAALELYVGELLPGFFVSAASGFEHWLEAERAVIRRLARTAALELAASEEDFRPIAAAGWLRRSLEVSPDDEPTVRRLMTLLAEAGDGAGALRVFEALERRLARDLDIVPSTESQEVAARIRSGMDRGPDPSRDGRARQADPGAYDLYVRGMEMVERDREGNEGAIERYREAIRLDPHFAEAHAALAMAYSHQVELFGASRDVSRIAIASARRAIALNPDLPIAHLALGQNLETLRRLTDAGAAYRRAVELDSEFAPAFWALAQLSTFAGDFEGAIVLAERALVLMPGDPRPFLALGLAYYCLDWPAEAEAWYERALSVYPDFTWALASLAYFRTVSGEPERAVPLLDRILRKDPDSWVGITCAGEHALLSGDMDGAAVHLERALSIDSGGRHTGHLRTVAVYLAMVLQQKNQTTRAEGLLDHAEALNLRSIAEGTEFGGVSVDIAAILALRKRPEEARPWLQRASGRDRWRQFRFGATDPTLDPLRGRAWFRDWLGEMETDVARQRERTEARKDRISPP